jgi:hypothetical protein
MNNFYHQKLTFVLLPFAKTQHVLILLGIIITGSAYKVYFKTS